MVFAHKKSGFSWLDGARRWVFGGAFIAALMLLSACGDSSAEQQGQQDAAGAPQASPVSVARPLVMPVDEFSEFSGRFEATDTVDIRSRVSGYLMDIKFQEGSIVRKGDPLFVIDPRQIEATLRQRQADLKVAQSQTAAAVNDFKRAQSLFESGDVSEALLDQRRAARDSALAAVDAARAGVDSARVDLNYTTILAPITGRIGRANVTVGNLITPGQEVLTTIVSVDPIHFYFDVDERAYVNYARQTAGQERSGNPGIPVYIALTDENEYRHRGTMDFIDNAINNSTGTMRGRAVLANPDALLTPGMFGRARIRTGGAERGILIPDEAVMIDQSRKYVYVVDGNGIVSARTIETGLMDKGLRIIAKGLDGSETVIVNGLQRAREGAPVIPQMTTLEPRGATAGGDLPPPPGLEDTGPEDTGSAGPATPAGAETPAQADAQ